MKLALFAATLGALLSNPNLGFAQYDGTSDISQLNAKDAAFVVSCKGNAEEEKLLIATLLDLANQRIPKARKDLQAFKTVAAPHGQWRTAQLSSCYDQVKARLLAGKGFSSGVSPTKAKSSVRDRR